MNDCNASKRNSERGFTLIELLVTSVVAAILLAIAIPSFSDLIERNQATTAVNDLMGDVMAARSEAIKRDNSVTLCRSNNESTCSGTWGDGWILFSDPDGDATVDAGEQIIRVKGSWGNGLVVSETANQTELIYTSLGIPVSTVKLRIMRGATIERCIDVNAVGRPTIAEGDCP